MIGKFKRLPDYDRIPPKLHKYLTCPYCHVEVARLEDRTSNPTPSWWKDNKGNYHQNTKYHVTRWLFCPSCGVEKPR